MFFYKPTLIATTMVTTSSTEVTILRLFDNGEVVSKTLYKKGKIEGKYELFSKPEVDGDNFILTLKSSLGYPSCQLLAQEGNNILFFETAVELWNSMSPQLTNNPQLLANAA